MWSYSSTKLMKVFCFIIDMSNVYSESEAAQVMSNCLQTPWL